MEMSQIAMKLVLDRLGEDDSIKSVSDRLRVQKAIYLAQIIGINLGYQYSWYLKGPYSTALTQDYYKFSEAKKAGDREYESMELNVKLAALIPKVKSLLTTPTSIAVDKATWYETLASLHFLIKTSKYDITRAKEYLQKVKPHTAQYLNEGIKHLKQEGLVS